MPSFRSINSSSLSRKKYDGDRCTPTHLKQLQGENMSVGVELIELNFNIELRAIFQTLHFTNCFAHIFFSLYLDGTKSFVLKTELYFTIFELV